MKWPFLRMRRLNYAWYGLAVVLLLMAAIYLGLHCWPFDAKCVVAYLAAFFVPLFVLFMAEGAEIATACLQDKEPEQLEQRLQDGFRNLQDHDGHFVSGRQFLVVVWVVFLAFLAKHLTIVHALSSTSFFGFLKDIYFRDAFAFLFATFIPLWYAQLLPKMLAKNRPLDVYCWSRFIIWVSTQVGRWFEVGAPSNSAFSLLKGRLGHATRLLPGKAAHFENSAELRDGKGLVEGKVTIKINPDGSVRVERYFKYQSYGSGFTKIKHVERWTGEIDEAASKFDKVKIPRGFEDYRIYTKIDDPADKSEARTDFHSIAFEMEFNKEIPVGESIEFWVSVAVGPGAAIKKLNKTDRYQLTFREFPVKTYTVYVMPSENATFVVVPDPTREHRGIYVRGASDNVDVNSREAARMARAEPSEPAANGVAYRIEYPLTGSEVTFFWQLQEPSAKPHPASVDGALGPHNAADG